MAAPTWPSEPLEPYARVSVADDGRGGGKEPVDVEKVDMSTRSSEIKQLGGLLLLNCSLYLTRRST
jgi:hypothetical protein